jgi:hypothetical protein
MGSGKVPRLLRAAPLVAADRSERGRGLSVDHRRRHRREREPGAWPRGERVMRGRPPTATHAGWRRRAGRLWRRSVRDLAANGHARHALASPAWRWLVRSNRRS